MLLTERVGMGGFTRAGAGVTLSAPCVLAYLILSTA